ncbi:MAG: RnfH family protein [Pseudomonadota bacterium]
MPKPNIQVEVIYALPNKQVLKKVTLPIDSSVKQAISISGVLNDFPGLDLKHLKVGIFAEIVSLDHLLKDGDRVEIYRDLIIDPKQARRLRAKKK